MTDALLDLYDPRIGDLALRVESVRPETDVAAPRRSNYFTMIWVREGRGTFWADLAQHPFEAPCLLSFVPYLAYRLVPESPVVGHAIQFHANFFCIETYHEEVGCNGVLFNDVYGIPLVRLEENHDREFEELVGAMCRELREGGLAQSEVLVSYLKILLVRATRLKLQQKDVAWTPREKRPAALDELRQLIEEHYRSLHKPAEYAWRLHMTPKSLAKLVKAHLGKTPTELIRERIMRQAKWEMLHTEKPVKRVARELGFEDVFYFSRLFKRATGCSPAFFREFETEIRGGRNLSMPGRVPSMVNPGSPPDHGGEPTGGP